MCQYFQIIIDSGDSDYEAYQDEIEEAAILKVYNWMHQNWHMFLDDDYREWGPSVS